MKRTTSTRTQAASDEAPKISQAFFDRATYRVAGVKADKAAWQAAVQASTGKRRISIMLDVPVIEHFRALAGERGYQTLINDTLRRSMEGGRMVDDMRLVLRQELAQYKVK